MSPGAGRKERGGGAARGRSRCRRRRGHALGVQPPESEMQRYLPGLRSKGSHDAVPGSPGREDAGNPDGRPVGAGRVLRTGDQQGLGGTIRKGRGASPRGRQRATRWGTADRRYLRSGSLCRPDRRAAAAGLFAVSGGALRAVPCCGRGRRPRPGHRRDQPGGVRPHRRHFRGRSRTRSPASSTRSRPACATPTSAPVPRPAPGPGPRRSVAGRVPGRVERVAAGRTMSPSSCGSRAEP